MLIDGIQVPLAEPFYRDGALYLRKLEHNVRRYSLSPVSGMVVMPPGGESSGISDQEKFDLLQVVSEAAAREKVLIAGVQQDSVRTAVELSQAAYAANFDALLLAAPSNWQSLGNKDDNSTLSLFFRSIADAVSLPVLLWSDSAQSGFALPLEMLADLAGHPNIVGMYDGNLSLQKLAAIKEHTAHIRRDVEVTTVFAPATRRMKRQESVGAATFVSAIELGGGTAVATAPPAPALKTRTKTVGFQVMVAAQASGMVSLFEAGVSGAMPRLATCAPQACFEAYAAFKDGDLALAHEKATRLEEADALLSELGIVAAKYGCDLNGYFGGNPRLPRLPLKAEERLRVEVAMRELKN